ncbi:uncharacterized protein DSM5745_05120 [Aspergillus mulundensis]|uniref:Uncharacterized protein n=1 Tax=Aspergillus mulundensis TaxID=1810919 RepID=A0A3D8S5H8_9EURO|nr:hypothetical protein DSM5745_05120 [Aspergillus mulundensis]RDW81563.1 hypothetical protein DSM5745_05120 [Aspergillus mulundensis]
MSLPTLPRELILQIAENASSPADILALAMTTKSTHALLAPRMIKLNIKLHNASGLTHAVRNDNPQTATAFLDAGADINTPCTSPQQGRQIERSIKRQKARIADPAQRRKAVRAAIAAFRDTGKRDPLLYTAARIGSERMVRLLLARGAERAGWCWDGDENALGRAARNGHHAVVLVLWGAWLRFGTPVSVTLSSRYYRFVLDAYLARGEGEI